MLAEQRLRLHLKLGHINYNLKRRNARQWVQSFRNRAQRSLFDRNLRRTYERRVKQHSPYLPSVTARARTILRDIETEGVSIDSARTLDLPLTDEVLRSAAQLLPSLAECPATQPGGFRVFADQECFKDFPQLFLWGLNDVVLDMVENYLGVPVGYHKVDVIRSIHNGLSHGARMWHLDGEDHRTFRIIIYLNDVDHGSGPFEYIPRPISQKARQDLKYSQEYVPDDVMSNVVRTNLWKSCVGPRGTIIFADPTNVFHRGKMPTRQERFAIFYSYHSARPMYPRYLPPGFSRDIVAYMNSKLSERQRASVYCRG